MDAEELQNRLGTVSQRAFRGIVGIVLHDVFSLQAINVDGAGDGGRDWLVFSRDGNVVLAAIQDTIQSARWEEKALADAKTAETVHHPNRYYFLTKRHHQQTTVTRLEDEIVRQTGMATTVLEARRIAELIIERSLEGKVLEILGEGKSARPPRAPEIAFWVYTNLSADRLNHRNQIYDDTLLCVLYEQGSVARSALVDRAVSFLGCPVTNRPMLDRRVDALISSRKIARNADGLFALSSETRKRLNETEGLYLSDWNSLTGAMTSVLEDLGAHWDGDQSERGAVLLARWFVLEQVNCLRNAKADVLPGVWLDETADPQQQLRDLLQLCGVKARQLDDAIGKLIAIARDRPAVLKLTRTAVFAALEGSDPLLSSKALGAARWEDVSVLLDACVAMPALCALLTSRVESYLFAISQRAVEMLDGFGVKLRILPGYLEECASHLLRATRYEPVESEHDLAAALKHSENAFVAYYYALKAEEKKVPSSLHGFLKVFSERVVEVARNTDSATLAAQKIMPDLQRAFSDYGILLEQPERIPALRYGEITRGHDVILAGEGREKVPRLRAHDIAAMAHLEGRNLNRGEIWMLLTWDGVVIKAANKELKSSWVVSPEIAIDFAQPCRKISEAQLCALAHRIARIADPGECLTAKILDEIVRLKHTSLQDWEFRDELRRFRNEAVQRAPVGDDNRLQAWIEREAAAFVASQKIDGPSEVQAEMDEIVPPEGGAT